MEPTQDDVGPSAVFSPAGQRGGRPHPIHPNLILTYEDWTISVLIINILWWDFTGSDAELQPDARLLPVPAGQTLRPFLRHRRQSAAVRTPRGHLQAVAHVESQGKDTQTPLLLLLV